MFERIINLFHKALLNRIKAETSKPSLFDFILEASQKQPIEFLSPITADDSLLAKLCEITVTSYPTMTPKQQNCYDQLILGYAVEKYMQVLKSLFDTSVAKTALIPMMRERLTQLSSKEYLDTDFMPQLNALYQQLFGPQDLRLISPHRDRNRRLRRLDSLARLLSLSTQISACSAVTLCAGELIIAANVKKEEVEQTVLDALHERLSHLRALINRLSPIFLQPDVSHDEKQIKALLKPSIKSLIEEHGISVDLDDYEQALYKFTDAILFDEETFTPEERALLMSSKESRLTPSYLRQLPLFKHFDIQHFHAEQLIKRYVIAHPMRPTGRVPIGTSKLCCTICDEVLSIKEEADDCALEFEYSGTHRKQFIGTVNTDSTLQAPATTPTCRVPLEARPSPGDTPGDHKSAKKRRRIERWDSESQPSPLTFSSPSCSPGKQSLFHRGEPLCLRSDPNQTVPMPNFDVT